MLDLRGIGLCCNGFLQLLEDRRTLLFANLLFRVLLEGACQRVRVPALEEHQKLRIIALDSLHSEINAVLAGAVLKGFDVVAFASQYSSCAAQGDY